MKTTMMLDQALDILGHKILWEKRVFPVSVLYFTIIGIELSASSAED